MHFFLKKWTGNQKLETVGVTDLGLRKLIDKQDWSGVAC